MLFNSYEFILLFLPITFIVYFLLNKAKLIELSKGWLVLASLFYYSYWKIEYLPLILLSMIFNYSIGSTFLGKENLKINKKLVLSIGIVGNVLLLGYYKYFNFLLDNFNALLHTEFNYMKIFLPLAISFFTFQQIAYLVDSYKGETKEYDFLNYALFVTFFPQLIAGPIVHHGEMMPQFANLRKKIISHKNISIGLFLFIIGLSKKVLIADNLSGFVHEIFDLKQQVTFFEGWLASFAYSFQLYFDFSGYTDMALGIGSLFNISLPQNFNSPYKATSIQDFWRRWHMTLSRFLRDYIYIPLGGNKKGEIKTFRNLFLTFLIGGIWHGAGWTFVVWGVLHGIAVCANRFWQRLNININRWISIFITFMFVNFTWIFFRAHNFADASKIIEGMLGFNGFILPKTHKLVFMFSPEIKVYWVLLLIGFVLSFWIKNSYYFSNKLKPSYTYACIMIFLAYFSLTHLSKLSEFLYFQF